MTPHRTAGWLVLAFAVGLSAAPPGPAADPVKTGFVTKKYKNPDGGESQYVVFVPHGYNGTTDFPVLLFLHGSSQTKGKGGNPVDVGIGPVIKKTEKAFPFITVIPQAEAGADGKTGWAANSANGKRAMAILDETLKAYKTDPNRVYLTGLSMGGIGTWSLAVAHPDKWAAIVPICGRGNPDAAEKIKDIPCWAFHGDKDTAVPVAGSRDMIAAMKKAGGNPKYTEYKGVDHNSWDRAYATNQLYLWLLDQKKK